MHGNIVEHWAAKMTQIVFVLVKREKKNRARREWMLGKHKHNFKWILRSSRTCSPYYLKRWRCQCCFFCHQVSKNNDVITKPSHPGCRAFSQSAFDSLIIALSCTVTLADAFCFVCLQDDGAWSADAGPELDFSGGWPGHCCGELLRFYAPHSLAYPYTNLYKLACDQFPSCPTVVINWFNYTHAALEKCVCERSEGGEMIIRSHACACTVPTYCACVKVSKTCTFVPKNMLRL